ncbi:MAG: lysine--tRNA ligase [Candidatus Omnitrophica bacterium CG08_land_8_20_14_0_20_41_16]|uniref:Lysine--tRNA ligase n=1 Tax=Candidatus Sherwoodlollariibacterium unditelluris TaxID=1974757 RepID=A0A2G9YHZ2_9BACT|nr:MAG: lysine--tRNA ligase [Candidatus Omnitrophica bacterium CG23_combo_of_CG06-09_8_20_14_all_41_10]PIS34417.1 MAG: lysine--tRNA ligase [Candidatus Omnitrophica bacterium CG08_land_8_20_14_0_20_41_16]
MLYNYKIVELNELIEQRKAKAEALKAKGLTLYPAKVARHIAIGPAIVDFKEGEKTSFCGRITAKRSHGKAAFLDLRDSTGKIQLYIRADIVGVDNFFIFQNLDIADIIYVEGELFKTHTGEPSVKVEKVSILSKALRPLPEKWHGLKDVELRYRQRYLDLASNEDVRKIFMTRASIIKAVRVYLDTKGFLEVETPMMHSIAGGACGRPFKTYHNEYSMDLFLRIAPELYLKQLLVGGMDKVYEMNRSFRNEGVSTRHNPEFTMLEVYSAYSDFEGMMCLAEGLIVSLAQGLFGKVMVNYQGKEIDFTPPWRRVSFAELVREKFDIIPSDDEATMLNKLKAKGFAKEVNRLSRSQIVKIIEEVLEEGMNLNPTFVTDYFTAMCPLAKAREDNPLLSERFELYIAGLEIGNAYSELNDPLEQRRRFEEEIKDLLPGEKKNVDDDYCLALEHGMPPAGGLGIGIDRLVMLLTDQLSIRDVILFPLLRSEQK